MSLRNAFMNSTIDSGLEVTEGAQKAGVISSHRAWILLSGALLFSGCGGPDQSGCMAAGIEGLPWWQ